MLILRALTPNLTNFLFNVKMATRHTLLSVGVMRHVLGEAVFKDLEREVHCK